MSENEKLDLILRELGGIKEDVSSIKVEMQTVKEDLEVLKGEVKELKEDVRVLKGEVQELKEDVKSLNERVTTIEITLENETNRNIQLIAEGHMNLDRKLDEALKELHPNTMYHLKVNHLDGEVTKMKRVLNMA